MTELQSTPLSLSEARRRTGLTIRQFSANSGVAVSTIQALELGTTTSQPRQVTIDKLLASLNIDLATFDRLRLAAQADSASRLKISATVAQVDLHDVRQTGNVCSLLPGSRRRTVPSAGEYAERERHARSHPLTDEEVRQRLSGLPDAKLDTLEVRLRHEAVQGGHRRRRRAPRGISQAEVAARSDISVEAYRAIEQGRVIPHTNVIKRLSVALGIDEHSLTRQIHLHYRYHSDAHRPSCNERSRRQLSMGWNAS